MTYVGAELYNKRMFPHGCPSYQKAFVKLFKVEKNKKGIDHYKLIDMRIFNNRDGFGYIMRNLTKGQYQVHFKKYSTGFDVFDFTMKIFSDRLIKIDDEDEKIKQVELSKEIIDKIPTIQDKKQVEKILSDEKNGKPIPNKKEEPKQEPHQ